MTPGNLVAVYQRFGVSGCRFLRNVRTTEQPTRRHIPEDSSSLRESHKNFKSQQNYVSFLRCVRDLSVSETAGSCDPALLTLLYRSPDLISLLPVP